MLKAHPDRTEVEVLCDGPPYDQSWRKSGSITLVRVKNPGGVLEKLRARFQRGQLRGALGLIAQLPELYFEQDAELAAWRVRLHQDLERPSAHAHFVALLKHAHPLLTSEEAPGLLNLFSNLGLDEREAHSEALLKFLSSGRVSYESWDVRQLFDLIEIERWPTGYLNHRLRKPLRQAEFDRWCKEAERRMDSLSADMQDKLRSSIPQGRAALISKQAPSAIAPNHQRKRTRHRLLGRAVREVPERLRSELVFHEGAAPPSVHGQNLAPILPWIARWLVPLIDPAHRTRYDEILRKVAQGERAVQRPEERGRSELAIAHRALPNTKDAKRLSAIARDQAAAAVQICAQRAPDRIEELLRWLDDSLILLEFHARLRRLSPSAPPELYSPEGRVVLRRLDPQSKPLAHIVRFENEYALLHWSQGRLRLQLGSPEEIMASVPDEWFDEAITAMM